MSYYFYEKPFRVKDRRKQARFSFFLFDRAGQSGLDALRDAALAYGGAEFEKIMPNRWKCFSFHRVETGFYCPAVGEINLTFSNPLNDYKAKVSPRMFGLLCTLFAMRTLLESPAFKSNAVIAQRFADLWNYARVFPEVQGAFADIEDMAAV